MTRLQGLLMHVVANHLSKAEVDCLHDIFDEMVRDLSFLASFFFCTLAGFLSHVEVWGCPSVLLCYQRHSSQAPGDKIFWSVSTGLKASNHAHAVMCHLWLLLPQNLLTVK